MDSFSRAGLHFRVADHGPSSAREDGAVVVCLHGFPQGPEAYDAVVPRLTAAGLRVLVPEQRGYGAGARPPHRRDYALPELVADVLALLDALPDGVSTGPVHLVGHDWGGVVAWAFAAAHPDRLASLTVLSQAHPAAYRAAMTNSSQAWRSTYVGFFQLPVLPERLLTAGGGRLLAASLRRSGLPTDLAAGYARRHSAPGSLRAALGWYRALPFAGGVGRVDVPTTYVRGTRDPFYAEAAVEGTAGRVRGPFRRVDLDTGHWIPELRPDAVAEAVLAAAQGPDRT
ncbi:alpha/beta fold hydrolase [Kineococcus sp. NPDC059986]|uniref:alpha/beta fold hydrolase n=1 Tax=Kineococcus sp. NPDC059986 TaxID=3155538 RepID=UPI00344DDFBC